MRFLKTVYAENHFVRSTDVDSCALNAYELIRQMWISPLFWFVSELFMS